MSPITTMPMMALASHTNTRWTGVACLPGVLASQVAAACASPSASAAARTGSSLYTLRNGASAPSSRWSTGPWNGPPSDPP